MLKIKKIQSEFETRDKQEPVCLRKERRTEIAAENWQMTWTASHDQFLQILSAEHYY